MFGSVRCDAICANRKKANTALILSLEQTGSESEWVVVGADQARQGGKTWYALSGGLIQPKNVSARHDYWYTSVTLRTERRSWSVAHIVSWGNIPAAF